MRITKQSEICGSKHAYIVLGKLVPAQPHKYNIRASGNDCCRARVTSP